MKPAISDIQLQIIWSRLIAAVEEQARSLIRAGFSTSTREAGDVSAGIFSRDGEMLAQAITGTPGHVNSMARSVKHFLAAFPLDTLAEGDVLITNDPWKATGHLSDISVVTPVFRSGRAVALFACTTHVVDIGGNGPSPESRQVFGEGLFIPIMKLAEGGAVNQSLLQIIRANVREPVQVEGDIFALMACNDVGNRRLQKIMDEYSLADLSLVGERILAYSRRAMMAAIESLPRGTWHNSMRVDGYEQPIDLVASVTVDGSGVHINMAGTSGPSRYGINCPLCYTEAYAAFGVKSLIAPALPNNAATLSCITLEAPEDCIANAKWPRPVVARSLVGMFLPDLIFGCFRQILADKTPAESTGSLWNVRLAAPDSSWSKAYMTTSFHSGGAGARPRIDGLSATPFPSGVKNVPVEITEAMTSVVVWEKSLLQDSGGAGQFRGGLGQKMVIGNRFPVPLALYARFDRVNYPARGCEGGLPGRKGLLYLASGKKLNAKGIQEIPPDDRLVLEMPGGGGWGKPEQRSKENIISDVEAEYISKEQALEVYGLKL